MAKAWVYQDDKQVKKHGEENASWYVGWLDPAGKRQCKSCGAGKEGKRAAERFREKVQSQLNAGTYNETAQRTWADFRKEYEAKIAEGMNLATRTLTVNALDAFERIVKPAKMVGVNTQAIDEFIRRRGKEPGKKKGSLVSPATVNKDLRHLRAVLTVAVEWGYLKERPRVRMVKEPKKHVTFVKAEDFAAIYQACEEHARLPGDLTCSAAAWWRALLVFAYMTGWRISEILALRREDVDLKEGTALTRAEDNKGARDDLIRLHPVVVEHLKAVAGFAVSVFPWNHDRRPLDDEFDRRMIRAATRLNRRRSATNPPLFPR